MSVQENKDVYIRMIEYGRQHSSGFTPDEIRSAFSEKIEELNLVNKLLEDAWKNNRNPISHPTPFVLSRDNNSINYLTDCKYTLSYEANFNYLDYEELQQAKSNAKDAHCASILAIGIAIVSMIISAFFSYRQIISPVSLDSNQYERILKTIDQK